MNNKVLVVPEDIRYISEWKEFALDDIPHIIDKQIPGCGFTEWCITNNEDTVICSPRRILLENKRDQHADDVLYIRNTYDDDKLALDKDLSKKSKSKVAEEVDQEERLNYYSKIKEDIESYIIQRSSALKPCKILVTYDSFKLVKDVLVSLGNINRFRIIVDEFQSIFTDSRFKSDTELEFLNRLEDIQKVCYVSATPMIDRYLRLIPNFSQIPYYELDWKTASPNRVMKPKLVVKTTKSLFDTANKIIEKYKSGKFETRYIKDPLTGDVNIVTSREAVIYVNSVNNILSIIGKSGLKPEECNILCAKTPENESKIKKKLGKDFGIGTIPLKGEQHKMFTFCTRTVYLGADFYSTCARTFIISDANIETLAVDISLDLPQILGRQRLNENPWKNSAEFYYKPLSRSKVVTEEEFNQRILEKEAETNRLLSAYSTARSEDRSALTRVYDTIARDYNYKDQYVAVNSVKTGRLVEVNGEFVEEYIKIPVENTLVKISEQRAYDIQQLDYADRFNVFNIVDEVSGLEEDNIRTKFFLKEYEKISTLYEKLKFLCDLEEEGLLTPTMIDQLTERHFTEYFSILGADRVRASGYNITKLNRELGFKFFDKAELVSRIYEEFKVGERYTLQYIKDFLAKVYEDTGYDKSPVASDIEEWFNVKIIQINIKLGQSKYRRDRGYEILSKK